MEQTFKKQKQKRKQSVQKQFENAVYANNIALVKLLLKDKRVDPSHLSNYAICAASNFGYAEIIRLLLNDNRVDPLDRDAFSLEAARGIAEFKVVRLFIGHGYSSNDAWWQTIQRGFEWNHTEYEYYPIQLQQEIFTALLIFNRFKLYKDMRLFIIKKIIGFYNVQIK